MYNPWRKPLAGEVIVHTVLKDKRGKTLADRRFRTDVHWPAQATSTFLIETDFEYQQGQSTEWWLEEAEDLQR